jgi:16S rRNA (cytidine1402-2'-O)-methyltransferase
MLLLLPHPFTTPVQSDFGEIVKNLDGIIGESPKEVQRIFGTYGCKYGIQRTPYAILNEHTNKDEIAFLAEPLLKGENWGLMSDAGLPCLADPGAKLVLYLKLKGIEVKALPAPSPLFYALMLSGLPSQRFYFHGYLPKDKEKLVTFLRWMEEASQDEESTHYFIEAPYRNMATFETAIRALSPKTLFSVATALFTPEEKVITKNIHEWRRSEPPRIDEVPTIFLLHLPQQN